MTRVVIITGNPKFVENNSQAKNFYSEIEKFLLNNACEVMIDPGAPYTKPPIADLWIGHSRGADRLKFAPEGVKILAIGSSIEEAINHPEDNTKEMYGESDVVPNRFHYIFTDEMKNAILRILGNLF